MKLIEPCPQHDRVANSTDYGNFYFFKDAKVQKAFMTYFIVIYILRKKIIVMSQNKKVTSKNLFSMQNQII